MEHQLGIQFISRLLLHNALMKAVQFALARKTFIFFVLRLLACHQVCDLLVSFAHKSLAAFGPPAACGCMLDPVTTHHFIFCHWQLHALSGVRPTRACGFFREESNLSVANCLDIHGQETCGEHHVIFRIFIIFPAAFLARAFLPGQLADKKNSTKDSTAMWSFAAASVHEEPIVFGDHDAGSHRQFRVKGVIETSVENDTNKGAIRIHADEFVPVDFPRHLISASLCNGWSDQDQLDFWLEWKGPSQVDNSSALEEPGVSLAVVIPHCEHVCGRRSCRRTCRMNCRVAGGVVG